MSDIAKKACEHLEIERECEADWYYHYITETCVECGAARDNKYQCGFGTLYGEWSEGVTSVRLNDMVTR